MKKLNIMIKPASSLCNLRCKYCFAEGGDYAKGRKIMPFEVAKAAIDFVIEKSGSRRNIEIDFFGGEPLMNFQVVKDLVAYARSVEKEKRKPPSASLLRLKSKRLSTTTLSARE